MLAFQELNPGAFVDGNINRLKSGQVLRIPTEQQMLERSPREALSQVQAQNQSWRGSRNPAAGTAGARQLDATQRNAAGSAPSKVDATDNLRLVSGEGKASKGADKGGKGDSKAIADTLAVTKESLDSTRRENEELQSRMQDLQSQLDKLQKLIQLKDAQLAKLQGQLGAEGQGAAQPNAALPDASQPNAAAQAPAQPGTPLRQRRLLLRPEKHPPLRRSLRWRRRPRQLPRSLRHLPFRRPLRYRRQNSRHRASSTNCWPTRCGWR